MVNAVIMASGNGSNAIELIKLEKELDNINFKFIITDNKDAGIINKGKSLKKDVFLFENKNNKLEHEEKILNKLKSENIEWIFLAGYMRILSSDFINHFYDDDLDQAKIINIHPSLLPDFKGKDAYEQAFKAKVNNSGVSIHFVDAGIDTGKIITQKEFPLIKGESLENFKKRGLKLEHDLYPKVVKNIDKFIETKCKEDIYEIWYLPDSSK